VAEEKEIIERGEEEVRGNEIQDEGKNTRELRNVRVKGCEGPVQITAPLLRLIQGQDTDHIFYSPFTL
jgi:hypothetical protein